MWDEARIERVVGNILSNAVKYSPKGGAVTIVVEETTEEGATYAVLHVKDEGIGISPRDQARVFE